MSRLTLADIEAEIASEAYFTADDGIYGAGSRADFNYEAGGITVRHTDAVLELPAKMVTICLLVLHNGHKVIGVNYGSVDPAENKPELGRRYAREDAISKLWEPMGFRLRDMLRQTAENTPIPDFPLWERDETALVLTEADADADVAGTPRPDNPGLNTNPVSVPMQAKPSVDVAQVVRDREVSGRALGAALGAGAAQLSIGRLVHYVLSQDDATKINGRRTNGAAIQDRILGDKWSIGAQAHIGNLAGAGDVLPAIVVSVLPCEQVNLQVFLDGNDVFWATTRAEAAPGRTEPGRWHWPARV